MKKRSLSFILACALSITSLTACGSSKKAEAPTEASADQTQAASGEESIYEKFQKRDPITIKWLAYNTYGQPDEANSKIIQEVEKKYNVKFDFWFVDDQQWDQVLGVKLASGEMPDIMKIKNINNTSVYYDQGVLAEITDDILNKMPHYKATIEKYDTDHNIWVDTMIDGKRYALKSLNYDSSYPTTLVWRKDWLKNVGIDKIPETIDEWEEAMKRFTENDPDGNGKKDTYGMSNTTMNAIFGAYGAIPLKEFRSNGTQNLFMTKKDGKLVYAATQPETRQALEKLADWYKKGYIDPEFVTGENTGGY
ncbi:MAG: extracellular solute-binding protein, partial [Lacrimispora sphenoides]